MKTTIELPDGLFLRAKTIARQRGTTLRRLVIEGLETVTESEVPGHSEELNPNEAEFMELDSFGVPVLRRPLEKRLKVTNKMLDELREELGV